LLIVDDDADLRRVVSALLGSFCRVLEASDGQEALRIIRKQRPTLMLLDVAMPGMSGVEALQAARAVAPGLTVIMLTGKQDLSVARKALNLGADAYVTKPFDAAFLRDEVRRLLSLDEPEDAEAEGKPWRVDSRMV
jgi:DNA-binding response OmpR family regulator